MVRVPRGGDEGEFGVVGEQSGWGVGGGAGVDDVAAEGAAVLIGDAAGPTCGLGEEWRIRRAMAGCLRMSVKVVPAPMMMASGVTSMKRSSSRFQRERRFFGLKTAGSEGDHEFGAAGDGGVVAG